MPARVRERVLDGALGDLRERDAARLRRGHVRGLGHVPRDRLALAVEVGREEDRVRRLRRLLDLVDLLAPVLGDHVLGREPVVDVDPELALAGVLGQVADVAVRGEDAVIGAEVALDRPRLGRRLDDHQVLRHRGGSIGTAVLIARSIGHRRPSGRRRAQASRTLRRKSSSISRSSASSAAAAVDAAGLARSASSAACGISTKRTIAIGKTNVDVLKSMKTGCLPSTVATFVQTIVKSRRLRRLEQVDRRAADRSGGGGWRGSRPGP